MSKNIFITVVLIILFMRGGYSQNPNILVVIADDMGADALGLYGIGSDAPNTPNIDMLAANGIRFENAWGHPTCSPSRSAILLSLIHI